jgi:hypothetical protein
MKEETREFSTPAKPEKRWKQKVFIANDGKVCYSKLECINWDKTIEAKVKYEKITHKFVDFNFSDSSFTAHYIESEDELHTLYDHFTTDFMKRFYGKFNPPQWVLETTEYGGDDEFYHVFYTLEYIKSDFAEFLKEFETNDEKE